MKLTTTGFALTPTGERVAIKGLDGVRPGSTVQVQVKQHPSGTLQLQGLNIDTSKLTVLQELPDVSKVVIQEQRQHPDSIANILEEMKTEEANNAGKGVECSWFVCTNKYLHFLSRCCCPYGGRSGRSRSGIRDGHPGGRDQPEGPG